MGPTNLVTTVENIPPQWTSLYSDIVHRIGDPRDESGRRQLEEQSPINHVGSIVKPLLIVQGANDVRVRRAESDRIVEEMKQRQIPVTYIVFPDEGHGLNRAENKLSFAAVEENFLAQCLDGRAEDVGDDVANSSAIVVRSSLNRIKAAVKN